LISRLAGAARWRGRQRAKITLGLAKKFPQGRKPNAARRAIARTGPPPWPVAVTTVEKGLAATARDFLEQLHDPALLSPPVAPKDLPAALARLRRAVVARLGEIESYEQQAADLDQGAEAAARREARQTRIWWEVDRFLARLAAVESAESLRASQRQEDEHRQAMETSNTIVAGRDRKAAQRVERPVDRTIPVTIAPWLSKR
jgi:hypothetical protein